MQQHKRNLSKIEEEVDEENQSTLEHQKEKLNGSLRSSTTQVSRSHNPDLSGIVIFALITMI